MNPLPSWSAIWKHATTLGSVPGGKADGTSNAKGLPNPGAEGGYPPMDDGGGWWLEPPWGLFSLGGFSPGAAYGADGAP